MEGDIFITLKALGNQKYGVLSQVFCLVAPTASCLVMRTMLYRGLEVLKEAAWFISMCYITRRFVKGVLSGRRSFIYFFATGHKNGFPFCDNVKFQMLVSSQNGVAACISSHAMWCTHTSYHSSALQGYILPMGGSGLYFGVDEHKQFRENKFLNGSKCFCKAESWQGEQVYIWRIEWKNCQKRQCLGVLTNTELWKLSVQTFLWSLA